MKTSRRLACAVASLMSLVVNSVGARAAAADNRVMSGPDTTPALGAQAPQEEAVDPAQQAAADAGNAFALDLFARLRASNDGNLFFSPYSIDAALAMAAAGAKGRTATQMNDVLHLAGPDADQARAGIPGLVHRLQADKKDRGYALAVANAMWGQEGASFQRSYLDLLATQFASELNPINFKDPEPARRRINGWVGQKTREKIKDLVAPGAIKPDTKLVLTNAIYFKGDWADPFEARATSPQPFHGGADGAKERNVPTMHNAASFGCYADGQLAALQMPYEGNDVAMLVLLPNEADGLADVEKSLDAKKLAAIAGGLRGARVRVSLPKFKMTGEFGLAKPLAAMGMSDAFQYGTADFSGIDGTRELFISDVIHKAFVAVDEQGTEAAAATAVVMRAGAVLPGRQVEFKADHPFLIALRDLHSGAILFLGRVTDPSAE